MVEFRLARHVTLSFHQCVVADRDTTVAVVCDRNEPLVAIARPRVIGDRPGMLSTAAES